MQHLYDDGALLVIRSSGSHTMFDLVAVYPCGITFVQCKAKKKGKLSSEELKDIDTFSYKLSRELEPRIFLANKSPNGRLNMIRL